MSRPNNEIRRTFVRKTAAAAVMVCVLLPAAVSAMVQRMAFDEVVATADLIFFGQVVGQECRFGPGEKMIFTDVTFAVHEVVAHRDRSRPVADATVVLSLAGGSIGEQSISVSDVPSFVTGEDYVIFTKWDGVQYASPVVGVSQGAFTVTRDEQTGLSYVLGPGRHIITDVKDGELSFGPSVRDLHGGKAQPAAAVVPDRFHAVAPQPVGDSNSATARARVSVLPKAEIAGPITLEQFLDRVRQTVVVQKEGDRS